MRLADDATAASWLAGVGDVSAFEWDTGNRLKLARHQVDEREVVSMFHGPLLFAGRIVEPAHEEPRWLVLGQSERGRKLALVLTRRGERVRPISCRPMRRNEKNVYEEAVAEKETNGSS